jgi:hypothetical protein
MKYNAKIICILVKLSKLIKTRFLFFLHIIKNNYNNLAEKLIIFRKNKVKKYETYNKNTFNNVYNFLSNKLILANK